MRLQHLLALTLLLCAFVVRPGFCADPPRRPNVVWIVAEDLSPTLGCYGDRLARTPAIDGLARQGVRFDRCFTHAPVCAPSRSGLITGIHPTTLGSHHMRSKLTETPALWITELRAAGYQTLWPGKTDFNFDLPKDWVDSTADWTKKPELLARDRPFFAYINLMTTHESKIRAQGDERAKNTASVSASERCDPASVTPPPYYPDTPEVRGDMASYYDNVTAADKQVAQVLKLLDDQGLRDNTVVFFFGDHGWGMPRGKRSLYDSGTRCPLVVRWPGVLEAGTVNDDLVAFLDFGPTVLSIAGVAKPTRLQGQVAFGPNKEAAREFVFGARDRMDEAYDRIRAVRSKRYRFIKNFRPELPYAQWINYADEMPTLKEWRRLAFEGKLNETQKGFFARTKPVEEFYDLAADPHETRNLIDSKELVDEIARHRKALSDWIVQTNDLGEIDERKLIEQGKVKNVLDTEYAERVAKHPKTSPVP